jgi:hypothetical protein
MVTLQIPDVPDGLYRRLVEQSERECRSIAEQALVALDKGLQAEMTQQRRTKVLEEIWALPEMQDVPELPDAVTLIREDRDR